MAKSKKVPASYFKVVNPLLMLPTLLLVALAVVTYFDHKYICAQYFGTVVSGYAELVATKYKLYLKLGLLGLAALHITEALVAVYKCQKLRLNLVPTLGWVLQTILLGFFSLKLLIWPHKPAPQQHQQQQSQSKAANAGKQNKPQKNAKASKAKKEK
uniref:Transmembrane protein n=2 Tax=Scylla TaxID=6760 RepID=A0A0P4VPB3_SCYOL